MAIKNEDLQGVINDAKRKELVEYYKWVVTLSIFMLTVSATISGLIDSDWMSQLILVIGWTFLTVCIFFNRMLVKNFMWYPLLKSPRLGIYGTLQNWAFILGVFFVVLGYACNIGKAVAFGGISFGIVSVLALWATAQYLLNRADQDAIKTIIEGKQRSDADDH